MADFGLEGRVVVISGGAGGIGSAAAVELGQHGAKVALLDLRAEESKQTVEDVEAVGGVAKAFSADVTNEESVQNALDAVEAELGPIYGVVPAAGITRPARADQMPFEDFKAIVDVNLTGTWLVARAAAQRIIARGDSGSMVLIGSIDSLGGHEGRSNYAATKHGVVGMAKSLALDWGRLGIRVNVVCPGPVETPMLLNVFSQSGILDKLFYPRMPIGRLAKPADEARAITYFLSDYSDYVTGAVMPVDGGLATGFLSQIEE